jgi:SH3-like domain-containing protein
MRVLHLGIFLTLAASALASNKPESNRVPRFESLKSNNILMRVGPGANYPIQWEYHRTHLPMEIIAEFEDWRKVRDKTGDSGWIHKSMLSQKRYVIIMQDDLLLRKNEDPESKAVGRFQENSIAQIVKCNALNCFLMAKTPASTVKGWAPRRHLWGLYSHEAVVK